MSLLTEKGAQSLMLSGCCDLRDCKHLFFAPELGGSESGCNFARRCNSQNRCRPYNRT